MRILEAVRNMRAEIRSAYKSEDTEEWFDRVFNKPLGYLWAKLFIRLDWTPNQVTILSMIIGFAGGLLFYPKTGSWNLIGILLVIWANILDSTDGQIARLTGQKTTLGRILDGLATSVWYAGIYIAVGFRLMSAAVPFTGGQQLGGWIWVIILISAFAGHQYQCMLADYYRNIHLFFLKGVNGSELTRSGDIARARRQLSVKTNRFERLYMFFYGLYTRAQEASTPAFQRLYRRMEEVYGQDIPDDLRNDYLIESRKYIQLTNILTFNARAFTLFVCVLAGAPLLYFPLELCLFGALTYYMRFRYERIAVNLMLRGDLSDGNVYAPKKKKYPVVFFIIGLAGIILMLINIDFSSIDWDTVLNMMPIWLPTLIVLRLAQNFVHASAYRAIIGRESRPVGMWRLFKVTISGFALNSVTPVGFMGGEPYRIMELKPYIGVAKATASTITFTVMNAVTHIVFWLTGAATYFALFGFSGGFVRTALMFIVLILCAALCILLVYTGRKSCFARAVLKIGARLPLVGARVSRFLAANNDTIDAIDREMVAFLRHPAQFLLTLTLEYGAWLLDALEYFLVFRILGLAMSYPEAVFALTMASLIGNLMFFIPMQLGAREGGILIALRWIGDPSPFGITATLLIRLREILFTSIGVVSLLWKNTDAAKAEKTDQEANAQK